MFYLIGQIALTLFFTALIGITMGWLLRGLGTSRQTEAIEARWRARVAQLQEGGGNSPGLIERDSADQAAANRKIAELQKQIEQRDQAMAALRQAKNMRVNHNGDSQTLATQLRETTERCSQLQGHLAEQRTAADQFRAQLERAKTDREMLIERLRDRETEIGRMSQERQHAINTIATLQKEMRTMRGERLRDAARPGTTDLAGSDKPAPTADQPATTGPIAAITAVQEVRRPDSPVPSQTSRPAPSQPAPASSEPAGQQSLPIATDEQAEATSRYEPSWRLSAPQGEKDNLQAIFGIGPKLELQLNKLGIYHYEQIGRFQTNDILWVARHLKSFPGRIVRDRWIEQAQTLSNRKRS